VAANRNVGAARGRTPAVLTQFIPFIGYPRRLNGLRVLGEATRPPA
jgi:4-carboxymuconolactone decarboxylase